MNKIYLIVFTTLCTFALCNGRIADSSESEEETLACKCLPLPKQVCGNDKKKYINICFFKCEAKVNHKLKQVPCPKPKSRHPPSKSSNRQQSEESGSHERSACSCTSEYKPVCDNDLRRHTNLCTFHCAQRDNKDLLQIPCTNPVYKNPDAGKVESVESAQDDRSEEPRPQKKHKRPQAPPPQSRQPKRKHYTGNSNSFQGRGFGILPIPA